VIEFESPSKQKISLFIKARIIISYLFMIYCNCGALKFTVFAVDIITSLQIEKYICLCQSDG